MSLGARTGSMTGRAPAASAPAGVAGGMSRNTRRGSMYGRNAEPKDVIKGVEDISKVHLFSCS